MTTYSLTLILSSLTLFRLSRPPAARVSGVVEESPGNLEYEVALYRESGTGGGGVSRPSSNGDIPVEQAVPIGTKLQLRATIGTQSGTDNTES